MKQTMKFVYIVISTAYSNNISSGTVLLLMDFQTIILSKTLFHIRFVFNLKSKKMKKYVNFKPIDSWYKIIAYPTFFMPWMLIMKKVFNDFFFLEPKIVSCYPYYRSLLTSTNQEQNIKKTPKNHKFTFFSIIYKFCL